MTTNFSPDSCPPHPQKAKLGEGVEWGWRMKRREFFRLGAVLAAGILGEARWSESAHAQPSASDTWDAVRGQFRLDPDYVHMSALLVASHPQPVQEAIDRYRDQLNRMPVTVLVAENRKRQRRARQAAAAYLGADAAEIALTDSTTMGLGLVYGGMPLKAGDEILTSTHDYYATHESIRLATERSGATVRKVELYRQGEPLSVESMVAKLANALSPKTRVVALTWVCSNTGIKIPVASIGEAIAKQNANLPADRQIRFVLDGVHGFGIEDVLVRDLRCDFFVAGCHKWLFGPRGTGIVWGRPEAWAELRPTIPSFTDPDPWSAWQQDRELKSPTTALRMSPGGFKPFEHLWALPEAFAFHERIGKAQVQQRTRELASQLKEGLAGIPGVRLVTPRYEHLSAGIVSFDIGNHAPRTVVNWLSRRRIIATVTPYARRHLRLTPSLLNTPDEVEAVLRALRDFP